MLLLQTSLLLLCLFPFSNGIRVLRNTIDVSVTDPVGGAHLASVTEPVQTKDLTLCVRFNLKVLGWFENKAQLIQIEDWRDSRKDPDFRLLWFGAWSQETFFGFGSPMTHGSFASYAIKDPFLDTYQIWNPYKWSHVCLSYEKKTSYIRMVKDGRTLNINFSDPNLKDVIIPTDFLNKTYVGRCAIDVVKGCSATGATFTDFNVWDRALTEKEMQDWTACNDLQKGNLVNWETSGWDLENMVEEELSLEAKSLCKPFKMGHILFPEKRNITATIDLCHKLRGSVSVVKNEKVMDELVILFLNNFPNADASWDMFWGGYWDEYENGVFQNINNGELLKPTDFQPWYPGEPNGNTIENCMAVWPVRRAWNDFACQYNLFTFCEFDTAPYLQMRGLCYGSKFDTKYSWTGHIMHGHHSFQGYLDTVLYLDPETNLWRLQSYANPHMYATLSSYEYPLGTYTWNVYNDTCKDGDSQNQVTLNFNACTDEEFNCVDGNCIPISGRCDGRIDCGDKTDEIDCRMIEIDQSYIKEVPAPPVNKNRLTEIKMDVEILSILEIDEVEGIIAIQFALSLTWVDKRLVLNNLKEEAYFNSVNELDIEKIWIPQIVFFNTEMKSESLSDEKAQVTISRKGKNKVSPSSNLENVHVYPGKDNPLTIKRVYSVKFLCDYDMARYPFDKQTCTIQVILKGNTGSYSRLIEDNLVYLGQIDLARYYVKSWNITQSHVTGNQASIEIRLVFGRRILNEMLTTYLPTIFICIVAFSTNYYKSFFFEAVVTVNLTSLLVLTTLFISVSDSLPKTNYLKMIDIWLVSVLCVPFLEVLLHTLADYFRKEEKDRRAERGDMELVFGSNKITSVSSVSNATSRGRKGSLIARNEHDEIVARKEYYHKLKRIDQKNRTIKNVVLGVLHIGLPSFFAFFALVYFIVGLTFVNEE